MGQAAYLRTETIPLHRLTPFPGNARRGNVATILESLRRNGQYRSLIVRELPGAPLMVLAGNHTAEALDRHGPGDCGQTTGELPCGVCDNDPGWPLTARCEVVTCNEDTARRVNLIDNRAAEKGFQDPDALAELLSFLDDDLTGTGYDDVDVERLLAPPPTLEELADTYAPLDGNPAKLWPVLRLRVSPEQREAFYGLTVTCPDPNDETARFQYLLDRARAAPPH